MAEGTVEAGGPGDLEVADQPGVSEPTPDEEREPESEVEPEVGPELPEVVLPFIEALEASSSSELAVALELAADGSPAARYAAFTDGWLEGFSPGGDGLPPTTNTVLPIGEVRSCQECAETEQCSVFGAFTVAGGAALTPVGGVLTPEPASMLVTFSVTAGDAAVTVAIRGSSYQTRGGERSMTYLGLGPDMVEPGTTPYYGAQVLDVEPGGTFVLEGWTDTPHNRQTWEVTFPILPPR